MTRRRAVVPLLLVALAALGVGCREPLAWAPPSLNGTVKRIDVPTGGGEWFASTAEDCQVRMPGQPVQGRVKLFGCHDISLVGGEWSSAADPCGTAANGTSESVALYLANFSGVAHVEGVKIHGHGFSDGMWITSSVVGSSAQVEGSWIGGLAACSEPGGYQTAWPDEHPDCFQTWAGPSALRFDKDTCHTVYEGFNLDSGSWADSSGKRFYARPVDIRRTNVRLSERTPNGRQCFAVWTTYTPIPIHTERARCDPGARDYAGAFAPRLDATTAWWGGVIHDDASSPDETDPGDTGIGYRSPGYQ
jgi:hypothetical protein